MNVEEDSVRKEKEVREREEREGYERGVGG